MTVFFGVEAPLQTNEQVSSLDEASGAIGLCDFTLPGVNRVALVGSEGGVEVRDRVSTIMTRVGLPAWWTICWEHHEQGDYRIRSMHFARQLTRAGYDISLEDRFGVATIPLDSSSGLSAPPGVDWGRAASYVVLGTAIEPGELMQPPFRASSKTAARSHWLYPSREFIEGFMASPRTLAYPAVDSCDNTAWVIVTRASPENFIYGSEPDDIYRGKAAPHAWT